MATSTPSRTRAASPTAHHYVDNKALHAALVEYRQAKVEADAAGRTPPPIPEFVGECILRIATRLSTKTNFASYSYREEMISDAIENCLVYLHLFNPDKGRNPFAYFTQVCYYAFVRRIQREKKDLYRKLKIALHQTHNHLDYSVQDGSAINIGQPAWANYENVQDFIADYEKKEQERATRLAATKVAPTEPKGVFFDDDDDDEPVDDVYVQQLIDEDEELSDEETLD